MSLGVTLLIPESSSGSQMQLGFCSPESMQDSTFTQLPSSTFPMPLSVALAVRFDQAAPSIPSSVQAFLWRFVPLPPKEALQVCVHMDALCPKPPRFI